MHAIGFFFRGCDVSLTWGDFFHDKSEEFFSLLGLTLVKVVALLLGWYWAGF